MKQKFFLIITLIIINHQVNAQKAGFYIGGGFNSSTYTHTPLLNSILSSYNSTRPWLTHQMDTTMNPMTGLCFNMGIYLGKLIMDIDWVGRNKETYGEGVAPSTGVMGHRDLKIRSNSINGAMGIWIIPYFAMGFSGDFGTVKSFTRVYNVGDAPPDYSEVAFSDITVGISLFAQLMIPISKKGYSHIVIKPYYQFQIVASDYGYLHDDLVGSSIYYEAPDGDHRNNLGFEIKLQLGFGD